MGSSFDELRMTGRGKLRMTGKDELRMTFKISL